VARTSHVSRTSRNLQAAADLLRLIALHGRMTSLPLGLKPQVEFGGMSAPPHGVPYDCRPHRTVRIYRPLVLAYMRCSAMTGASSNGSAPMRHPTLRLGPDCTTCGADPRALRCRPPRRQSSRRGGAASLGIFAGVSSHARRAVRRLQYGVATSQAQKADRRARRRGNQLGGGSSCRPPSAGVLLRGDAALRTTQSSLDP